MKKLNNITNNYYSDEWYTSKEIVSLIIKHFKEFGFDLKGKSVICPFDSEKSEFVKQLKEYGSFVNYGMNDFLEEENYEFEALLTNPPFSIKDKVIERCIKSGKKCALILPLDSLGGVSRHELFKQAEQYPFVMIPNRRISYTNELGEKKKGSSMHSIIMFINMGGYSDRIHCRPIEIERGW